MTNKNNKISYTRYQYEKRVKEQEKLLAEKKLRDTLCKQSMDRFLSNARKMLLNNK